MTERPDYINPGLYCNIPTTDHVPVCCERPMAKLPLAQVRHLPGRPIQVSFLYRCTHFACGWVTEARITDRAEARRLAKTARRNRRNTGR